jgi:hypothetical protein
MVENQRKDKKWGHVKYPFEKWHEWYGQYCEWYRKNCECPEGTLKVTKQKEI